MNFRSFVSPLFVITAVAIMSLSCNSSPAPDLTAGEALLIGNAPVIARVPVKFSAIVANIGDRGTVSSFNNFFQVGGTPDRKETITDLASATMSPLDRGEGAFATSPTYSFPFPGTYIVRVCADKTDRNSVTFASGAVVSESNEDNNCGPWVKVTVISP